MKLFEYSIGAMIAGAVGRRRMRRMTPPPSVQLALVMCFLLAFVGACTDESGPTGIGDVTIQATVDETSSPGEDDEALGPSEVTLGSIIPIVSETGQVSVSIDGAGTNEASSTIQVDKPAGATVRGAYFAAASTGFRGRRLANGDVSIDGVGVNWNIDTPSSIHSWNHWADVTSMVKPKIDAAAAGLVTFTITEVNTFGIDGEILAIIFDDPSVTTDNTVVLLFGAQDILGDNFSVNLADPLDLSDPSLVIDMSLGISFGFQFGSIGNQVSYVDVNSSRLTSCAGGQDDGANANGALLTVGGLNDSNVNPAPNCSGGGPSAPRNDDELYDLIPFTQTGDTQIDVFTSNPSRDDNIFFAAFFLTVDATVTPEPDPNNRPVADADGPYTANEGSPVSFDGTGSFDADGDPLTFSWDFGDGNSDTGATPTHTYLDNGVYTVVLTVEDPEPASDTDETTATILNVPPDLGVLSGPADPVSVGTPVSVTGAFTDPGILDTHTVTYDWGDATSSAGTVNETSGSGTVSGSHAYAAAGVYTVTVTVTDKDGGSDTEVYEFVVVYDPDAGFVTGGGWIDSPAGAYKPNLALAGKATFGFVSKYKQGRTTPDGNTEFQFHAGDMNFHSDSYEWLVVTGSDYAMFKGTGTINGGLCPDGKLYLFRVWAGDDDPDTFRIRIWCEDTDGVETDHYDNGYDQEIGAGSIVVHTKKN